MLIHDNCGGIISVDLSKNFRILASPILGGDSIHVSLNIEITEIDIDNKKVDSFYCKGCSQSVEKANILVKCSICKSTYKPEEIYQVDDAIMYICASCGNKYSLDGLTKINNDIL